MKLSFIITATITIMMFSVGTYASNAQKNTAGGPPLTFDELKEACLNPAKFHNQIAPTNIQISCKDVQSKWIPDTEGNLSMGCGRNVTATIMSDKYMVDSVTAPMATKAQVMTCPRFKQVYETVETMRALSCDDVKAITGPATDFCASAINSLRSLSPESITIMETGHKVDLCNVSRGEHEGREQLGREQRNY